LQVPYYEYALDMILDNEPPADVMLTDQQHEMLENAAEMLYGLIHARYLVTQRGLNAMLEKFKNCDFGRCPRCVMLTDAKQSSSAAMADSAPAGAHTAAQQQCRQRWRQCSWSLSMQWRNERFGMCRRICPLRGYSMLQRCV
jgi:hypothetical protein